MSLRRFHAYVYGKNFAVLFASLLAMNSHVFLSFTPRDCRPPPTLRGRLNPYPRRRFPVPRFAKRPDVALYAIDPLFLLRMSNEKRAAQSLERLFSPPEGRVDHARRLCKFTVQRRVSPRYYALDPMLLPLGNPNVYHEVLTLQPLFPLNVLTISPP